MQSCGLGEIIYEAYGLDMGDTKEGQWYSLFWEWWTNIHDKEYSNRSSLITGGLVEEIDKKFVKIASPFHNDCHWCFLIFHDLWIMTLWWKLVYWKLYAAHVNWHTPTEILAAVHELLQCYQEWWIILSNC